MAVTFQDRLQNSNQLSSFGGERLIDLLRRYCIPQNSVVCLSEGIPINEECLVESNKSYTIQLIEGYDIHQILNRYNNYKVSDNKNYLKTKFLLDIKGDVVTERAELSLEELSEYVFQTFLQTAKEYQLFKKGDKVLIGLSGGVDSSALAILLSQLRSQFDIEVVCATFEDTDLNNSNTFKNAFNLCDTLGLDHKVISKNIAEEVFNLKKPLGEILKELMKTEHSHFTMYIDHHTTRRCLEVFASQNGINKIALGLHTTDLVAGLLNSYTTNYFIAGIPKREIGKHEYIYPLAFLSKKELHLFYFSELKKLAKHTHPNEWELNPLDRNFYYYLAEQFQCLWPGIEHYLFEAHEQKLSKYRFPEFTQCKNCGSHVLQQVFEKLNEDMCDVCKVFKKTNYLKN